MKFSPLILFFLILSTAGESAEKKSPPSADDQKTRAQKQSNTTHSLPQSTSAPAIIINNPAPAIEQNRPDAKSDKWPPTPLEVITVVIAAGAFIIAWRTLNAVRRQAAAAERTLTSIEKQVIANQTSANAAIVTAETSSRQTAILEASQRPWIMFQVDDWGLPDRYDASLGFGGIIKWSFVNVGQGPAFLTDWVVVPDIFPYPLPEKHPKYPDHKQSGTMILPPKGHSGSLPTVVDAGAMQKLFDRERCQVIYGFVQYHDSTKKPHITRFCVVRHKEGDTWKIGPVGPPDWVDYT